jgi:hypothetical protein
MEELCSELLLRARVRVSVSQRESELLNDWRFTAHQFVLASSPWKLTARDLSFQLSIAVIVLT